MKKKNFFFNFLRVQKKKKKKRVDFCIKNTKTKMENLNEKSNNQARAAMATFSCDQIARVILYMEYLQ